MSNPTLNRPASPVFSSSLGFGSTCHAFVACGATSGYPLELVSGTVGQAWEGLAGQGVGFRPRNLATGFPYTPSASPSIHIGPGSPGLYYVGCGSKSTDGNVRTVRAVFKAAYAHANVVSGSYFVPIVRLHPRDNSSFGGGVGIFDAAGTYTFRYMQTNAGTNGLVVGSLAYVPGHWYAIEASTDQSGGSGAYKYQIQVYDITTQTFIGSASVTNSTSSTGLPSSGDPGDLILGGDIGGTSFPFSGDFACVAYSLEYPAATASIGDGTPFSNFVIDPWATVRGTFATSGSLAAPANNTATVYHGAFSSGEGGCQISVAAPTGGATTTPTYTATIERFVGSSSQAYTPGTGTTIATGVAMDEGGAVLNYKDTTAQAGAIYFYRVWFTDGTSTVYFPSSATAPIIARRRASGTPLMVPYLGDSVREGPGMYLAASVLARQLDRPVNWFGFAKSGAYSHNWQPGTNSGFTLQITGSPTSGTFVINTALQTKTSAVSLFVPYNCTAAQLKTILEDNTGAYAYPSANGLPNSTNNGIGGAGNTTVTGGPLNAAPLTVLFNGTTSQKQGFFTAPSPSNSTLNNGATVAVTNLINGFLPDTTYFSPMISAVQAWLTADPDLVVWVDIAVGENDSTGGGVVGSATLPPDYANYHVQAGTYVNALGWNFVCYGPALARVPESVYNSPLVAYYGSSYPALLAAIDNGVNLRYGGDYTLNYVAQENLGGEDGLHSISGGNESNYQRWMWATQLSKLVQYGTLNPSNAPPRAIIIS